MSDARAPLLSLNFCELMGAKDKLDYDTSLCETDEAAYEATLPNLVIRSMVINKYFDVESFAENQETQYSTG